MHLKFRFYRPLHLFPDSCLIYHFWTATESIPYEALKFETVMETCTLLINWVFPALTTKERTPNFKNSKKNNFPKCWLTRCLKECEWCYGNIIKIIVINWWAIGMFFIESQLESPGPEVVRVVRTLTNCLHRIYKWNPKRYVDKLPENLEVQRSYIWTIRQLQIPKFQEMLRYTEKDSK